MNELNDKDYLKLVQLRHSLHQNPELSGNEKQTSERILNFIKKCGPDKIITNLGGNGIAAVYGNEKEPSVMFRADLDALPIQEETDIPFKSNKSGVGHLCGHDGHMATLAGLALKLSRKKIKKGRIVLLFQPSEETGQGAKRILNDSKFQKIIPDLVFAYHNIPGFKKNRVIMKSGIFSSASSGMSLILKGVSSHAAHPEKGISPVSTISKLINRFNELNNFNEDNFRFITIVGIKMGEEAFGTYPDKGKVHATLRAKENADFEKLKNKAVKIIDQITSEENIRYEIKWREQFKAVKNSDRAYNLLKKVLADNSIDFIDNNNSFRWSEDFGEYSLKYDSCLFGIGIGRNSQNLHNPKYYYPDEIMKTGVKVYFSILKKLKIL